MARLCKIQIIGNLGRDPELRYSANGRPVCSFNVAVNQSRKDQQTGEWTDETDWFRVTQWGEAGERAAEKLRKGNRVFVEGRFKTRWYERQDGGKAISLDVTADTVVPLDKQQDSDSTAASDPGQPVLAGGSQSDTSELDELPF